MSEYHSFLVCFHPDHTDVYRNGLPLGVIRNGEFAIHEHRMPDGALVPVKIPENLGVEVDSIARYLMCAEYATPESTPPPVEP